MLSLDKFPFAKTPNKIKVSLEGYLRAIHLILCSFLARELRDHSMSTLLFFLVLCFQVTIFPFLRAFFLAFLKRRYLSYLIIGLLAFGIEGRVVMNSYIYF